MTNLRILSLIVARMWGQALIVLLIRHKLSLVQVCAISGKSVFGEKVKPPKVRLHGLKRQKWIQGGKPLGLVQIGRTIINIPFYIALSTSPLRQFLHGYIFVA